MLALAQFMHVLETVSYPVKLSKLQVESIEQVIVVLFQVLPDGHFKHFERVVDH